jgi:hypothetical protein
MIAAAIPSDPLNALVSQHVIRKRIVCCVPLISDGYLSDGFILPIVRLTRRDPEVVSAH